MTESLNHKRERLVGLLAEMGGVVVAYSGGVDSTLLLKMAHLVLGDKALGVTAVSQTYPKRELQEATQLAREMGARHRLVDTDELGIAGYADNPPERCYFCKHELFEKLIQVAAAEGLRYVADGSNADDAGDYRPGLRAAAELQVRSPLKEAGLTKAEVRELSRELGLPTAEKPSFACLASRFPYGERITEEKLERVDAGEGLLRQLGLGQVRLRSHGDTARIEIDPAQFDLLLEEKTRHKLCEALRRLGFLYITLDLEGYRTGSMNAALHLSEAGGKPRG